MLYRTIKPLVVDAIQVKEPGEVRTKDGVLRVKTGDWLVRDPREILSAVMTLISNAHMNHWRIQSELKTLMKPSLVAADPVVSAERYIPDF